MLVTTNEVEVYFGDASKVASFFKITPEAFYQWKKRPGQLIPKNRAIEADLLTEGKLKYNPELYRKNTKTA